MECKECRNNWLSKRRKYKWYWLYFISKVNVFLFTPFSTNKYCLWKYICPKCTHLLNNTNSNSTHHFYDMLVLHILRSWDFLIIFLLHITIIEGKIQNNCLHLEWIHHLFILQQSDLLQVCLRELTAHFCGLIWSDFKLCHCFPQWAAD